MKVEMDNRELFLNLIKELGKSLEKNKRITAISRERLQNILERAAVKVQRQNQTVELEAQVTYQKLHAYISLEKIKLAKNEVKFLKELDKISHSKCV